MSEHSSEIQFEIRFDPGIEEHWPVRWWNPLGKTEAYKLTPDSYFVWIHVLGAYSFCYMKVFRKMEDAESFVESLKHALGDGKQ